MTRHVRTAKGVEFFHKPIGSPITAGEYEAVRTKLLSERSEKRTKHTAGHPERLQAERNVRHFRKEFSDSEGPESPSKSTLRNERERSATESQLGRSEIPKSPKIAAEHERQLEKARNAPGPKQSFAEIQRTQRVRQQAKHDVQGVTPERARIERSELGATDQKVYDRSRKQGMSHTQAMREVSSATTKRYSKQRSRMAENPIIQPRKAEPVKELSGDALWSSNIGNGKLSPAEHKAMSSAWVQSLRGAGSAGTNKALRAGEKLSADQRTLVNAVRNAPETKVPVKLYRAELNVERMFGKVGSKVGKTVTDPGITAATTNIGFVSSVIGKTGALVSIHAPAGVRMLRVPEKDRIAAHRDQAKRHGLPQYDQGAKDEHADQQEFLLPNGSEYRVDRDFVNEDGIRVLHVTIVPINKVSNLSRLRKELELSAKTPVLERTPAPIGKPGGPGLWRVSGMAMPPYFQQVRNALIRDGHSVAAASAITWSNMRKWAVGGGNVHPEVRKAARDTLAKLRVKSAIAHAQSGGK